MQPQDNKIEIVVEVNSATGQAAINGVTGSIEGLDGASAKLGKTTDALRRSEEAARKAWWDQHQIMPVVTTDVQRIMDRYNPLSTKLRSLNADFGQLRKTMGNSASDEAINAFEGITNEIAAVKQKMGQAGEAGAKGFKKIEKGGLRAAFATSTATREMTVMAHEILTGNFGRVPGSMMVLANRMNLTSILLNPMTLGFIGLAGAVIGVGVAMLKGAEEQSAMDAALIMTGNYAGTTSGALDDLAHQATITSGSISEAKATVTELAASGKYTADQIGEITTAVIEMADATGTAVDKTIKQFESLAVKAGGSNDKISKAIGKLDDQYHFLSLAVYDQIKALEEEGRQQEASKLATDEYAQTVKERTAEVIANLGLIQRGWRGIKNAVGGAIDAVEGWGKSATPESNVAKYRAQVARLSMSSAWGTQDQQDRLEPAGGVGEENRLAALAVAKRNLKQAEDALAAAQTKAAQQSAKAKAQTEGRQAADQIDITLTKLKTQGQDAYTLALKRYHAEVAQVAKANPNDPRVSPEAVAAGESLIMAQENKKRWKDADDAYDASLKKRLQDYEAAQKQKEQVAKAQAKLEKQWWKEADDAYDASLRKQVRDYEADQKAKQKAAVEAQKELDAITMAALPANERAIERINRQYDKYREEMDALQDAGQITLDQEIDLWGKLDKQQQNALDKLKEKGNTTAQDLKTAFTGWANGFSKDLNDLLWGADTTFSNIAESFGKMITNMAIQKQIVEPMFKAMDSTNSGGGNAWSWLASLFHDGGVVGGGPGRSRQVSPSMFVGAPRFHDGLLPDEFPAILQSGEVVIPRGGFGKSVSAAPQSVSVSIHNDGGQKRVADTQVNFDAAGFVVNVFLQDMEENGPIKQAMGQGAL